MLSVSAAQHRAMEDAREQIAFDRAASVRTYDGDGRLHVAKTHISKANVCEYVGKEIPDYDKLGLHPDKLYKLYRDPEELKKAADTFNNLPLLSRHVPVDARDHHPELIIGSLGTDAEFNDPYLDNSLIVWAGEGIDDIESELKKELSSAYRYRADMTPGRTPDGEEFDGIMRDIRRESRRTCQRRARRARCRGRRQHGEHHNGQSEDDAYRCRCPQRRRPAPCTAPGARRQGGPAADPREVDGEEFRRIQAGDPVRDHEGNERQACHRCQPRGPAAPDRCLGERLIQTTEKVVEM
jgi:hypothetical protein